MENSKIVQPDAAIDDYWNNFQLSPSRFIIRPTYSIAVVFFPYLLLLSVAVYVDIQKETGWHWTLQALTLWPMLILLVGFLVIAWAFYRWQDKIPTLLDAGVNYYDQAGLMANFVLLLVIIPLTAVTFFAPVWNVHKQMVEVKKESEDVFAKRAKQLERRIQDHLDGVEQGGEFRAAAEKLEAMQLLRPGKSGYPEWPFDRSMPIKLFASPIVSLGLQFLVDFTNSSDCIIQF